MGVESSEITPGLERPQFHLNDTIYSDALFQHIQENPTKQTPEYIQEKLHGAATAGKVDDVLSPGLNVTSLLAVADKLHIKVSIEEQWKYYYTAFQNAATILASRATEDPDAGEYYLTKSQEAQRKALEIQANLEQLGIKAQEGEAKQAQQTGSSQVDQNESGLSPEDEFFQSIEKTNIKGKFPLGLRLRGDELVTPTPQGWNRDFLVFGDSEVDLSKQSDIGQLNFLFNGDFLLREHSDKHFLYYRPYVPKKRGNGENAFATGYSVICYPALQDIRLADSFGRRINAGSVYFLMSSDKATELIKRIVSEPDGADFFERFLQKAVPDAFSDEDIPKSPGIHRVKSSELWVLDDEFNKGFDSIPEAQRGIPYSLELQLKKRKVIDTIKKKPYVQPVGKGSYS